MMRRRTAALGSLFAATLSLGLAAQPQLVVPLTPSARTKMASCVQRAGVKLQLAKPTAEQLEAKSFLSTRVQGRRLARAVKKVRKALHWHDDLGTARLAARSKDKPIFWIQALGTLEGFT
ncbi:MAG: hypothetical protein AAF628_22535 [Planctomycetota bacterium]